MGVSAAMDEVLLSTSTSKRSLPLIKTLTGTSVDEDDIGPADEGCKSSADEDDDDKGPADEGCVCSADEDGKGPLWSEGLPTTLPDEVKDKYQQCKGPKEKAAVVNAVISKDVSYSAKPTFEGSALKRFYKCFTEVLGILTIIVKK